MEGGDGGRRGQFAGKRGKKSAHSDGVQAVVGPPDSSFDRSARCHHRFGKLSTQVSTHLLHIDRPLGAIE